MDVKDRVLKSFKEALDLQDGVDTATLVYQEHREWSSIGHMTLVAALEDEFNVMLDSDDILAMGNFDKTVVIMTKYANA